MRNADEDTEQQDCIHGSWGCRMLKPPWNDHAPRCLASELEDLCPYQIRMWMFTAALITITQNWKPPRQGETWMIKQTGIHLYIWILSSNSKETSYQAMRRQGCFQVKEVSLQWLHAVWFQLYDILEKVTNREKERKHGCQGSGVGWWGMNRQNTRNF